MSTVIEGNITAEGLRFAFVVARFNSFVTEPLLAGARDAFLRHGGAEDAMTVIRVPGSFEIPLTCKEVARAGGVDAIVALGAVVRGATSHYDLVCHEAAKGIASVSLEHSIPIAFGIVTCDTIEQAIERAGTKHGNKGFDAALSAIEMAQVLRSVRKGEK